MKKFEITADSTCDLPKDELKELEVEVGRLEYTLSDGDNIEVKLDDFNSESEYHEFYEKLRNGIVAKTSILSVQAHVDLFTKMAERGVKTLLHLSQSYKLSPTVDNARAAIEIVKESFPDIDYKAIECDTTTVGEGMLVRVAVRLRDEGKTRDEVLNIIDRIKHRTQHLLIVNDLKFLARGGRISKTSANLGSLFQVKPVIEFGRDGVLKVCRKEIGLKKAMKSITKEIVKLGISKEFPYVCVAHSDNLALAKELQGMFKEEFGFEPEIRMVGTIIGAHVGPGAVAYVFISDSDRPYD